ncbi:MAG: saccharopine dehydrogenase NADP-binding domain-containing protein [Ferruginibacter sp.]|nr:saccharopine dehydrogenase NADP-binding domain-containing protein [Ferruginibacter sp.]
MKTILLFGAGKSATVLIDYLLSLSAGKGWKIMVADADKQRVEEKLGTNTPNTEAIGIDITDTDKRGDLISRADLVISMMPPTLHLLIAQDCLKMKKHLLTASYADDSIKAMNKEAKEKGILMLCEMGLDPGIDHMSAMHIIHRLQQQGATITSFKSHCGGLVAPESDNNPWHYKISWNPRNVVTAGKSGAIYREHNQIIEIPYEKVFSNPVVVEVEGVTYSYYANRNSLSYIPLYGLENVQTFVRTTLRYPDYMSGWNNIIKLGLTDESEKVHIKNDSLANFLNRKIEEAGGMPDDNLFLTQMNYLGLNDNATLLPEGNYSTADVLQFALEKKLVLSRDDKDMIVMLHEFGYVINGQQHTLQSSLVVKGKDSLRTAMAKTVGLPLGIAAKLILEGVIKISGVHVPILPEIYNPVLNELSANGISFNEKGN